MIAASLQQVAKTYRMGDQQIHALKTVSIDFPEGSFWAITGASGSGKSTMLNILGCLDKPDQGNCIIANQNTTTSSDRVLSDLRLHHLGFIFQSFNLIPQLTVAENIQLPLVYLGWARQRAHNRAEELAQSVGLGDRLHHRPFELSGGQQQRTAIARALANDPSILLADEPTGNLDSGTGDEIMDMIHALHQQGKTIIMVTHEPDIARQAQHCLTMRDGQIAEQTS